MTLSFLKLIWIHVYDPDLDQKSRNIFQCFSALVVSEKTVSTREGIKGRILKQYFAKVTLGSS